MEGGMTEGVVSLDYQDTGRLQKLSNLSSCINNKPLKLEVELLARALQKYCHFLKVKKQKMLVLHQSTEPV